MYAGLKNVTGRRNQTRLLWNRVTNRPRFPRGLSQFLLVGLEWNSYAKGAGCAELATTQNWLCRA